MTEMSGTWYLDCDGAIMVVNDVSVHVVMTTMIDKKGEKNYGERCMVAMPEMSGTWYLNMAVLMVSACI